MKHKNINDLFDNEIEEIFNDIKERSDDVYKWENDFVQIQDIIEVILYEFKKEYNSTPWYHNTANCSLIGSIEEMESLGQMSAHSSEDIFCYLGGRKNALDKLYNLLSKKFLNID